MSLLLNFEIFIQQEDLFQPKDKLLLAVSGGVDSVVLCELCKQAGYNFLIAHCNFQLRGQESERDEKFVKSLGEKYKTDVFVKRFETEKYAAENKISVQVAARELRYRWFEELVDPDSYRGQMTVDSENQKLDPKPKTRKPAAAGGLPQARPKSQTRNWIVTAHHLDDNIETVLMNFFKGTGIKGLRGMLPGQGKIIRPLLFARKEELLAFALENHLQWVEDSSNQSEKYSRNYLRHQLIPVIEKVYPKALDNLADNINRFRDIEILYEEAAGQQLKKLIEKKGGEIHIPVLKLKKVKAVRSVLHELIKDYNFSPAQVDEALHLLASESGKYILSSSHRILKNRNWLIISPVKTKEQQYILIEQGISSVQFPMGSLQIRTVPSVNYQLSPIAIGVNSLTACLDAKNISFPLLLRKWMPGDYFYPLGMRKKKKLARFFIDQKLSLVEKEEVWVLEMNRKIIWIVGRRIDDRFKLTEKTKNVLEISFTHFH